MVNKEQGPHTEAPQQIKLNTKSPHRLHKKNNNREQQQQQQRGQE